MNQQQNLSQHHEVIRTWDDLWGVATFDHHASSIQDYGNPIASYDFVAGEWTRVTFDDGERILVLGQLTPAGPSNIVLSYDAQRHTITAAGDFTPTVGRCVAKFFDRRCQVANRMIVSNSCRSFDELFDTLQLLTKKASRS